MEVRGDIYQVKSKRDTRNAGVEVHLEQVEYIMYKKDGRYFQPFELKVNLEVPLVITGDCLARLENKNAEEGEFEFQVYDKTDAGEYVLNDQKYLSLTLVYDDIADQRILTEIYYSVVITAEEMDQLKREHRPDKKHMKGKEKKRR